MEVTNLHGLVDLVAALTAALQGVVQSGASIATAVAEAGAAATQSTAVQKKLAAAAPQPGEALREAGHFIFVVGVVCVVLAQVLTARVIRAYGHKMRQLMNESSHEAFGAPLPEAGSAWPADRLLRAIADKRRAMLRALIAVVAVFSLSAGSLLVVANRVDLGSVTGFGFAITAVLGFAALTGPVVLLGLSAAHFRRNYWTWFGPATLAVALLQGIFIAGLSAGGAGVPSDLVVALVIAMILIGGLWWARCGLGRAAARVNAWRKAARWRSVVLVLLALGALLCMVALEVGAIGYLTHGLLMGGIIVGVTHHTLVDRVRRVVAPLLAVGAFTAVFAGLLTYLALSSAVPALQGWRDGFGVLLMGLLALAVAGLVGNFVLSWIGLAYEQKLFSDAQFQVFSWMIGSCALVVLMNTVLATGAHLLDPFHVGLIGCTALALVAYWAFVRYGFEPLPTNRRLLVLRVFSAERRGEQLMQELEERWRYIGPLMLIGGTDVATRTIDPAKAANFIRRRLQDICVPSRFVLHKRIAALDETPDPDGRYRVNEFFCTSDLWREAVAILLAHSDAVVLDLSEFTAERAGTAHELKLLQSTNALARTVFVVGDRTDLAAVRAVLKLPPESPLPAGRVVHLDSPRDAGALVDALVHCLGPTARPSPAAVLLRDVDDSPTSLR